MPSFSLLRFFKYSQSGFAAPVLLVLLVLGIVLGTYLSLRPTDFSSDAKTITASTNTTQTKRDPLLGVRVSDASKLDQALQLGVSKIRVSVESADAFYNQTPDQQTMYRTFGKIFSSAQSGNVQLIIVVKPASAVNQADLDNRLGLMKQALGANSNVVFELGNEPNGKAPNGQNFWEGDYDSFATFVKDASVLVRKHWPSNPIMIGALDIQGKVNSTNDEAAKADVEAYLEALSKKVTLNNFDYAIHSYHTVEWFNRVYEIQKSAMASKGVYGKLWLTETGTTPDSGPNPPQQLVDIIKAAEGKTDIKAVVIHSLDSTDGFQLLDGSTPNDKYKAVQQFVGNNPSSVTAPSTPTTPGGGTTITTDKSCSNDPVAPPSASLVWHAFCNERDYAPGHFTCNSNSDCPQNTIEQASGVEASTSNQCVKFKEGSRCIQLRTKAAYKADDPAFETPNDTWGKNPAHIPFGHVGLGPNEGTGKAPRADFTFFISSWEKTIARIKEDQRVKELLAAEQAQKQQDLLAQAEAAAAEAKAANEAWLKDKSNAELAKKASDAAKKAADAVAAAEAIRKLAKLEQLLQGKVAENCVKADLGIRPWLYAPRIKAEPEKSGGQLHRQLRLYVCSGKNANDLKWRVATEGSDNNAADEAGPSMERIYLLHGESKDVSYPAPKYPFDGITGHLIQLQGQSEQQIRASLDKYIQAAKAGKAELDSVPAQVVN